MEQNERAYYGLTHPQKRIWYIDRVNLDSPLHNIGGCISIHGKIDVSKMQKTINIVIKNNEGLRLRFIEKDGEPAQYIHEFYEENIDFVDFTNYEESKEEYEKWSEKLFKSRFDIMDKQLYYFAIFKISEDEYGVLLNIHHIISDGWSISLIQRQVCEVYSNLIINLQFNTDEIYSYIDFVKEEDEYLKSERFIKNKNFWNEKFNNIPEEFLYKTSNSLDGKRLSFDIDSDLSNKIKLFIDDKKCSLNTFFMSVLLIYINKISYKSDLVIGTPVFNRTGKKQKGMVGMFTSTVPFRFNINNKINVENLIKLINKELKACLVNQKYPYDLLVKDLELSKNGYDSLYKMCVNYYNSNYLNDIKGMEVETLEYYSGNQSYSLQLTVKEWKENNITLNFDYKILEYTEIEIKSMYRSMLNIINQVLISGETLIKDIKLLSKEETDYKLYSLNSRSSIYPKKTVQELFEEQALKTPNKVALEFKEITLTYRELNERSNQIANYLKEKGIGKKSIVGIMETHSIELLISILGVLKAGAAYLPIDPSYPIERINYMLEDSGSSMLITNFKDESGIKINGTIADIAYINLDLYSKENLTKVNDLNDLAYIIYTSGSTGKPKGVMLEHQGLTNYIWWANKTYLKSDNEVMALYSSISFDLTVTSIFTPLISGSKIVIYENDEKEFVLYKILRENKATVVKLTPAHLTLLKDMDNSKSNIKRFIVGGEDLKVSLAKEVSRSFGESIEICNEYGPTETVVGCMIYKFDEEKDKGISVPIGYPADNVQIYILDEDLNVVPTGIAAELYVSGDGVARGYLNREELTLERFIENPFIRGKKMYRTGDTAKYLENGAVEYVGRIDNQVKIRGHRIELGEIEKYLLEYGAIKDAVVIIKEDSIGNKVINAYVVNNIEITDLEIKNWLLRFLPKYMIPTNFIFMDKFPLTLNGKVDYKLLPEPVMVKKEFLRFRTREEEELIKAMEEILGVKNISMNDNYYQLGGDSIKAIQIASKLKNKGLDIKVKHILAYESIEEIAATVAEREEVKMISQKPSKGTIKSMPIIEWFFSRNFVNQDFYNQYALIEYIGTLDVSKVKATADSLIEHHDSLRINYNRQDSVLFYNNDYLNSVNIVEYVDLSKFTFQEQKKEINKYKASNSFNVEKGMLFNIIVFNLGCEKNALLFKAHHLLVDGVSWRIILEDFFNILIQLENGENVKLPLKTNSFREWSEALKEYAKNDFCEEKTYWQSILNKDITYPVDFNMDKDSVETTEVLKVKLDENSLDELIIKGKEIYNLELNDILIIALVISISRFASMEEVVIELERHGREDISNNIDVSRTVGWFTSMYPAFFKVENVELESNIKSLKEQLRNIPNKGFNFSILKYLNIELEEVEKKYIRFNYLGDFDNIIDKNNLNTSDIEFGLESDYKNSLTALIDVAAIKVNGELEISATYSNARYKKITMQSFIDGYIATLTFILDKCFNKSIKEFTPSDFDSIDISQEDLDALFD
ncbi:amino acid adenylation domain-containing protein [Clostridium omnivorum]|uniref:Carrier domain-containing protein n=1 Tax=Clostridium omnivorum TaxID=1604902 RepID=A0ABQ5NB28_9CLOT|nr:amino acid adenylation domain-containing protein [Clostridium sp. E14]GLC32289.1 hypothetical protein bsdE14_36990 [Clostridium sp. E14]